MTATVGVCVVGDGAIAQIHCRNVAANKNCQLLYIVGKTPSILKSIAEELKATALEDIEDALKDVRIRAVMIASPTVTHYEYIMQSLRAGKHVFCEKPLVTKPELVQECFEEARARGLHLLCGFMRRFDRNFSRLRASILNGDIGTLQLLHFSTKHSMAKLSDPTSFDMYHEVLSHELDLLCFFSGLQKPSEVFATSSQFPPPAGLGLPNSTPDVLVVVLKYEAGLTCVIELHNNVSYMYDQRVEASGEKGLLVAENERESTVASVSSDGTPSLSRSPEFYSQRYADAYRKESEHFLNVVINGVQPFITFDDCYNVAILAEAIKTACQTHSPVILK